MVAVLEIRNRRTPKGHASMCRQLVLTANWRHRGQETTSREQKQF